ncbi:alpha/beta fold hydrolase [Pacificibacter marinus]|uniref:alpha/beta fold hydrolase n=1 Tax=Pacificibacter marinus TaxID=658057 RepID=UPI001C075D30|nr:alpha/beta fold hydrolase [Pacificibacter marinus]MBU2866518.1 alpha/beta fold hydrolase [Pacificibacter marinus]
MHVQVNDIALNILDDGPKDAPAVVFAHPLGTNMRIWDAVCDHLPKSLRRVRYDARGHGATDVTPAPYRMGQLVTDAEQLLDHLNIKDCVFVGAGYGGLIAQGLAVKRLDQIRAMVLCGTAAKLGPPAVWDRRIAQVKAGGTEALSAITTERSFTRSGRDSEVARQWINVLRDMSDEGYIGNCNAISGTDFYTPTSGLRLPSLGLCGIDDRITPPDLMRETLELIPGARFELIRRSGHYPMLEAPETLAALLRDFLTEISHA